MEISNNQTNLETAQSFFHGNNGICYLTLGVLIIITNWTFSLLIAFKAIWKKYENIFYLLSCSAAKGCYGLAICLMTKEDFSFVPCFFKLILWRFSLSFSIVQTLILIIQRYKATNVDNFQNVRRQSKRQYFVVLLSFLACLSYIVLLLFTTSNPSSVASCNHRSVLKTNNTSFGFWFSSINLVLLLVIVLLSGITLFRLNNQKNDSKTLTRKYSSGLKNQPQEKQRETVFVSSSSFTNDFRACNRIAADKQDKNIGTSSGNSLIKRISKNETQSGIFSSNSQDTTDNRNSKANTGGCSKNKRYSIAAFHPGKSAERTFQERVKNFRRSESDVTDLKKIKEKRNSASKVANAFRSLGRKISEITHGQEFHLGKSVDRYNGKRMFTSLQYTNNNLRSTEFQERMKHFRHSESDVPDFKIKEKRNSASEVANAIRSLVRKMSETRGQEKRNRPYVINVPDRTQRWCTGIPPASSICQGKFHNNACRRFDRKRRQTTTTFDEIRTFDNAYQERINDAFSLEIEIPPWKESDANKITHERKPSTSFSLGARKHNPEVDAHTGSLKVSPCTDVMDSPTKNHHRTSSCRSVTRRQETCASGSLRIYRNAINTVLVFLVVPCLCFFPYLSLNFLEYFGIFNSALHDVTEGLTCVVMIVNPFLCYWRFPVLRRKLFKQRRTAPLNETPERNN